MSQTDSVAEFILPDTACRTERLPLADLPTPVYRPERFSAAIGARCTLILKRDDQLGFAFGGNKVRKMEFYGAAAQAAGVDTLISSGGLQSNHARVVAATAARLGMKAVLITNGSPQETPTANALLARLFGAEHIYVADRDARGGAVASEVERRTRMGRKPMAIPLGASTPLGALGFVYAARELRAQGVAPDVIIHSASSGGTSAGLVAGCDVLGLGTRIIAVSADEPETVLRNEIQRILAGLETMLNRPGLAERGARRFSVDDSFVGDGYGIPTPASSDALTLLARTEAILLDPTYTAKAMAALIAYARSGRLDRNETVVFWHTGGQVGLFS